VLAGGLWSFCHLDIFFFFFAQCSHEAGIINKFFIELA